VEFADRERAEIKPWRRKEKGMGKIVVVAVLGVFVGAMIAEIVRKTDPKCLQKIRARIMKSATAAKDAFMEGYGGTQAA